jgi:uncharacterized caspase-like protein
MVQRLLEFGDKAKGADIAVFYNSGQGISVDGSEFLLATDADIKSRIMSSRATRSTRTWRSTMSEAKTKLVFLDASRSNRPEKAKSRRVSVGTSLGNEGPDNSLVVFATARARPRPMARKAPFRPLTRALIANIAAPGIEIQRAMTKVRAELSAETRRRQMPLGHNNLTGEVHLPRASFDGVLAPSKAART